MTPRYNQILWWPPNNIHKFFITKNNIFFWNPPPPKKKNIEIKIFLNPQKWPEPTYVWKYQTTPLELSVQLTAYHHSLYIQKTTTWLDMLHIYLGLVLSTVRTTSVIFWHPEVYTRHMLSLSYRQIHTSVCHYNYSFFPISIFLWNMLPSSWSWLL